MSSKIFHPPTASYRLERFEAGNRHKSASLKELGVVQMSVQEILNIALYAVIICFTLLIVYCEITRVISSKKALQVSESSQLQLDLSRNIVLVEEHSAPAVSPNKITDKEIDLEPTLLPLVTEEEPIDLAEFRKLLKPMKSAKPQMDFTKMNLKQLQKECSRMGINWRYAVTNIKTGKKRHLRKAEIVVALQQKLIA